MELLAERFNLADGNLIGELAPAYETPQVRVITDPQTDHKPAGTSRGPDLLKLLEEAHELATTGNAPMPREVAPIPVDRTAQRQFSFSRLTGQLIRTHAEQPAPGSAGGSSVELYSAVEENLRQSRGLLDDVNAALAAASDLSTDTTTEIDHRGLGTLVHDVLERIDFANPTDIAGWCEHLAPFHVIQNTDQAVRLASKMIERLVASPRGHDLATAKAVHREIDCRLAWPPDAPNPNGQYIQGVIDCLYEDSSGNWHILDFKTNDVPAKGVARNAEQYELQLQVYAI